jgi:hypothetical protein
MTSLRKENDFSAHHRLRRRPQQNCREHMAARNAAEAGIHDTFHRQLPYRKQAARFRPSGTDEPATLEHSAKSAAGRTLEGGSSEGPCSHFI